MPLPAGSLPGPPGRRLLVWAYGLALLHVAFLFAIGEPYPSLQGPMFAGHMQVGRTVHVPISHPHTGDRPNLPSRERIVRHETLALPMQTRAREFAPEFERWTARQFLIGHSLRTPFPRPVANEQPPPLNWSTYRFEVPWNAPPRFLGEEDLIND